MTLSGPSKGNEIEMIGEGRGILLLLLEILVHQERQ